MALSMTVVKGPVRGERTVGTDRQTIDLLIKSKTKHSAPDNLDDTVTSGANRLGFQPGKAAPAVTE